MFWAHFFGSLNEKLFVEGLFGKYKNTKKIQLNLLFLKDYTFQTQTGCHALHQQCKPFTPTVLVFKSLVVPNVWKQSGFPINIHFQLNIYNFIFLLSAGIDCCGCDSVVLTIDSWLATQLQTERTFKEYQSINAQKHVYKFYSKILYCITKALLLLVLFAVLPTDSIRT